MRELGSIGKLRKTSNAEHRTSNAECYAGTPFYNSMFEVRSWMFPLRPALPSFRLRPPPHAGERAERDEQPGESQADDERFGIHDVQFHEQITAQPATRQTADQQPPAR